MRATKINPACFRHTSDCMYSPELLRLAKHVTYSPVYLVLQCSLPPGHSCTQASKPKPTVFRKALSAFPHSNVYIGEKLLSLLANLPLRASTSCLMCLSLQFKWSLLEHVTCDLGKVLRRILINASRNVPQIHSL